jgi:Flp pilus assembly protein TadG
MTQATRIQDLSGFRKRNAGRRGNAIIEFAFVFVLFFIVLMTMLELGRGTWVYASIATATRRAGDYCMVRGSLRPGVATDIPAIITRYTAGLDQSELTVVTTYNPDSDAPFTDPADASRNDIAQVRVTYPFRLVIGMILPDNLLQMTSTTRVVVAN